MAINDCHKAGVMNDKIRQSSVNKTDFTPLTERLAEKFAAYRGGGGTAFASSSLQTQSVPLLHLIAKLWPEMPVYFVNTGFHFPETLEFRDTIIRELGVNIIDLKPLVPKIQQRGAGGALLYTHDPDRCCQFNKIQPLEAMIDRYDIWVNGVRRDQTAVRKQMPEEETLPNGSVRYHPMLDWTADMIETYIQLFNLPRHPLAPNATGSVGCEPCTTLDNAGRGARWDGLRKTECGLHTRLRGEKT